MPEAIRDVMTPNPISVPKSATVAEAARAMKDADIGDVIVMDGEKICGIVTDRDIVVRAIAEERDPQRTKVGEICSPHVITLEPTEPVSKAIQMMREKAIRRVPVTEGDKPIGIVSIGDLALERDRESALADISAAPPNT